MRDSGQTYGVVVVNNPMCVGYANCKTAIQSILPQGSTLVVWDPDKDSPTTIRGKAQP